MKSKGPDKIYGFSMKEFANIHEKIIAHLNKCLQNDKKPDWVTKGRTCLIMKDEKKGKKTSNFRPITYLPIMWKGFTGILVEQVYGHVERQKLFTDE